MSAPATQAGMQPTRVNSDDAATAADGPPARIKGAVIRDFILWHVRENGQGPLARAVQRLPADQRDVFDLAKEGLGVLSSDWIAASAVHAVLDDLTKGLSAAEYDELARKAADAAISGMMTGVQKIVFATLMTPNAYAKIVNLAFRLNYEHGRVISEQLGPTRQRGYVEGWASHHPFLCRLNVEIKARVYRAMKCEDVRIEARFCRSLGDKECSSIIVWR